MSIDPKDYVFIRNIKRETFEQLRDMDLERGLVVINTEFNIDSQLYEMSIRHATIKDI